MKCIHSGFEVVVHIKWKIKCNMSLQEIDGSLHGNRYCYLRGCAAAKTAQAHSTSHSIRPI